MRFFSLLVISLFALGACTAPRPNAEDASASSRTEKERYFKNVFLKKFQSLTLPLTLIPLHTGERPTTDPQSADTLFLKSVYVTCYGLLPDTTAYYGIIWQGIADFDPPFLTTFTKSGEIIDEAGLYVGQCDGGDCDKSCSETITINRSYELFSVDTVMLKTCDSIGTILKKSVFYKSGKVDRSGRIRMEEVAEEEIDELL